MQKRLLRASQSAARSVHARPALLQVSRISTMAAEKKLKSDLRAEIKAKLSELSSEEVERQSQRAQDVILALPQFQTAKRVGIYLCMPSGEAQTYALVQEALEHEKKVFVPYIHSEPQPGEGSEANPSDAKPRKRRKIMSMLRLDGLGEYDALKPDSWGIPTLPTDGLEHRENAMGGTGLRDDADENDAGGLDLIVVPGLAFDLKLNRIGHGAGFYDQFLTRFCGGKEPRRPRPYLVGLCLAEQVLAPDRELVMQEWDWKVDAVAVGDGRFLTL